MIDPASRWFEIVELLVTTDAVIPMDTKGWKGNKTHNNTKLPYIDKSSAMISNLVYKTWFSCYPRCQYIIYDNGNEFKIPLIHKVVFLVFARGSGNKIQAYGQPRLI
jgi:hypothetical protein